MERKKGYFPVTYVCTTEYDATMPNVLVAFPHRELTNIFGEYIARQAILSSALPRRRSTPM